MILEPAYLESRLDMDLRPEASRRKSLDGRALGMSIVDHAAPATGATR